MTVTDLLPREFRQILAELELLSHGTCQAWNKSARAADPDNKPAGESNPPHETFRIDYYCASTDLERTQVLHDAQEALDRWRKGRSNTATIEPDHERRKRIIADGKGWTLTEVARAFRTHENEIFTIRVDADLDPSNGKRWPQETALERARRLSDAGMSIRRIAAAQDVEPSTVSRRLKAAA